MGVFSLSDDKQDSAPTPENPGNVAAVAARADVAAELPKRKRGRPPGTGKNQAASAGTGAPRATPAYSPELTAEIQRQLEQCYDPKAWGALLAAPCAVMETLTGGAHWNIGKDETDTLGAAGSTAARFMAVQNPRNLAFMMLASALFAVYVPRITIELKERQKNAKRAREDATK